MAARYPQFRVLDLLPPRTEEHGNDMIRCQKRVVDLNPTIPPPNYEALSYVWGHQTECRPIIVEGSEFLVTKSLHDVLCRLRLRDRPRALWIDQICIDQSDVKDKEDQLPLIGKIYSNCTRGLIWLGEIPFEQKGISLEDARAAFDIVTYMAVAGSGGCDAICPGCLRGDEATSAPKLDKAMAAMKAMSRRENPWWRRIWTVQEAALPATSLLLWGPLTLSWDILQQATLVSLGGGGKTAMPRPLVERIFRVEHHRSVLSELLVFARWLRITSSRTDEPLFVFRRWRNRLATDPRDKVYGLLGLLPPRSPSLSVVCDYSRSVAETFTSLTVDLIAHEKGLRPLASDPRLEPDKAAENIPSWALDLSTLPRYDTDWFQVYSYDKYRADDGLPTLELDGLRNAAAIARGGKLRLKGVMVDVIQRVGQRMIISNIGWCPEALDLDILRDWRALAANGSGGEFKAEKQTLANVLLGDWIVDVNQVPRRRTTVEDVSNVQRFLETGMVSDELRWTAFAMTRNQRMFKTRGGLLGLGHLDSKEGDEVWILSGGRVPFILATRKERVGLADAATADTLEYNFVGRSYVKGIMYGERLERRHGHKAVEQFVDLY